MNYKYLGNALDLFKYDFITYLTRKSNAELFYIPMWTTPEKKQRDPKYALYEVGRYNTLLMDFLKKANEDNSIIQLSDVITFLKQEGVILNYITQDINLSNSGLYIADSHAFFTGEKVFRDLYFNQACQYLLKNKNKKLIFIDPDVGIDNGTSQRFRKCPQMYFTISELKCVLKNKGVNDMLCFFQHLGNPKKTLEQKIEEVKGHIDENIIALRYRRISMALVIFLNKNDLYTLSKIQDYASKYSLDFLI